LGGNGLEIISTSAGLKAKNADFFNGSAENQQLGKEPDFQFLK
jgi:hypothetical protein